MKKLIGATSTIMIIFSNTATTLATINSFEKINIDKRQISPNEPQPGPSWQNDNLLSLDSAIKKKNLDVISNFNPRTILNRLRELNPDIDINDIYLSDITYNTAIVRPLSIRQYSGITMIFFRSEEVIKLSNVITNTNLNNIPNFTQEGILQRIQELNPNIDISQLYVDNIGQNSALVKPLPNSVLYKGPIYVKFDKRESIAFSKLLLKNYLGNIQDYNPRTILNRLQELNPDIDINQLYVQNITTSGALIRVLPNSKIYKKDHINVYFIMPFLQSILMNINLGEIEDNKKDTILRHVRELNPGLTVSQLQVSNITENSAVISSVPNSSQYEGQVFVIFFIQKKRFFLNHIIHNNRLILPNFEVNTILQNLQQLNPNLDISQLIVMSVYNHEYAIVKAMENSSIYRGTIKIYISHKDSISLDSSVVNTHLNTIPNNNIQTILHYFQEANPEINLNELYVEHITTNRAIIRALPSSSKYHGKVIIDFNLLMLNDIIINCDLGEISENSPTVILTRLHEINPDIVTNELSVQNITENNAKISEQSFPIHFQKTGTVTVNFKANKKVKILRDVITNNNLGFLQSDDMNFFLTRLYELNPNLDINQIYIANFTQNSAVIRARGDLDSLIGEVTVYFTHKKKLTSISSIIFNPYLGYVENLLPETIIRRFILLNPDIDYNQIEITNITQNSAVIRAQAISNIYSGRRIIYFSTNPGIHNLENIIPFEQRNLGGISDFRPGIILSRLHELNPDLELNQLIIQNISTTSAEILSRTDSNIYTGQTTVYFYFEPIHYLLTDVIMNRSLGEISENSPIAILTRLHELNPDIVTNELSVQNITENSAEIVPVTNSTLYDGQVTVNFRLGSIRDLSSELTNPFLGDISDSSSPSIFNNILELNPNIDINQIDITNITKNSAIIKPNLYSIYKNKVQVKFETPDNLIKPNYSDKFEVISTSDNKENSNLNLTLSKKTFRKITLAYFEKEQKSAINEIAKILKTTTYINNENENEIATVAAFIWIHFPYYKELYDTLSENQSVLIKTNTESNWDNTNPEKYNNVLGKNTGYKNKNFLTKTLKDNDIAIYNEKKENKCLEKFSDSYNIIEGYYGNWFKLRIRLETLIYIKILFYINNKKTFIDKLSKLLFSFEQTNNSNFKSYRGIALSDIHNTAYMIWEHFSYYQNLIYYMTKGQSLILNNKSNTNYGYWDNDEPWKYNEVVGQKITSSSTNTSPDISNKKELEFTSYINHQNNIYNLYPSLLKLKQKLNDECIN